MLIDEDEPPIGLEEEEEECNDEDCEYCRLYYIQQMQMQAEVSKPIKLEEVKQPSFVQDVPSSSKIVV